MYFGGRMRRGSACVVRFRPEQICAVTDSVLEQQWLVRLISSVGWASERLSPIRVQGRAQVGCLRVKTLLLDERAIFNTPFYTIVLFIFLCLLPVTYVVFCALNNNKRRILNYSRYYGFPYKLFSWLSCTARSILDFTKNSDFYRAIKITF